MLIRMGFSTERGNPNSNISLFLDAPSGRERHSTLGDSGWRSCHREATWSLEGATRRTRGTAFFAVFSSPPPAHIKRHPFISVGLASVWQSATDTQFLFQVSLFATSVPMLSASISVPIAVLLKALTRIPGKITPLVRTVPEVMMGAVTRAEARYVTGKRILTTCPVMMTRHHNQLTTSNPVVANQ